jgi:hypothetical protein
MTGTCICPYCLGKFKLREVCFRCLGQITGLDTNHRCKVRLDERLASYIGSQGPAMLGPVFSADGSKRKARCPDCGVETYTRVCPACHNDLPADFGQINARIIALIGGKESGKSTYITVLVHELRHRVGDAFDASVEAMDDRTIRIYRERFEDVLYRRRVMLLTTQPAAVDTNYPLLYRFTTRRHGLIGDRNRSGSLVLFDTAGEDLQSRESIDLHLRYLAAADGIVLLIDPLQIDSIRHMVGGETPLPGQNTPPDEIVSNVTQLIRSARAMKPSARIRIPMAVVVTKIDTLWPHVPPGSYLRRRSEHTEAVDERDLIELSDEMQSRLQQWEGGLLGRQLSQNYSDYRFFAVSALGAPPDEEKVAAHGVSPFRVEDPVLWLLAREGMVPTQRAKP